MTLSERKGFLLQFYRERYFCHRPLPPSETESSDMARFLGVSTNLYLQWERGDPEIPEDMLEAALKRFGVRREDFDFHVHNSMKPYP